jgi:hypothetical protein
MKAHQDFILNYKSIPTFNLYYQWLALHINWLLKMTNNDNIDHKYIIT